MHNWKKHKLNILLCSSFHPGEEEMKKRYKAGDPNPETKIDKGIKLEPIERMNLVRKLFENQEDVKHYVHICKHPKENLYQDIIDEMRRADWILILLYERGFTTAEHTLTQAFKFQHKTTNVYHKDEKLSPVITRGTFLDPKVIKFQFDDDKDLLDLAQKQLEIFQFNHHINEIKKKSKDE